MMTIAANGQANGQANGEVKKVNIEFKGERFVVPEGMDYDEAIVQLQRQKGEDSTIVAISEKINCFPLDGAVALTKALQRKYGWTNLEPSPGFFGSSPPTLIGVEIGFEETIQVPWGRMSVPKINGHLETSFTFDEGVPCFRLTGNVQRRDEEKVAELAKELRGIVKNESIYRGKAVRINFRDTDGDKIRLDANFAPRFMDLSEAHQQEAIYSASIEQAIMVNLLNLIRHSEQCRKNGIPLKRGVLLGGPYGTGKTLTAYKTIVECVKHGWTFLYLEDVRDLDLAIPFARLYQPCVLFAEDVDRAVGPHRDAEMDRILNTLDGITSKNCEIITILTTNHLPFINRAFLRPGRIDAVIEVTPPDLDAMLRMVRKYGSDKDGRALLSGSDDEIKTAIKPLLGANASFVREVVERSKLSAITREGDLQITPQDLAVATEVTLPHIKLLNPDHGHKPLPEDAITVNPLEFAMDIVGQKLMEKFVSNITNPKVLEKVVMKKMGQSGYGSKPSMN